MKKIILISLFFTSHWICGQLFIDPNLSVIDMVKRLEGDGVFIENITYSYDLESDTLHSPIAVFVDNTGILGMRNGLLLTNGAAVNAVGPNNRSDATQTNFPDEYEDVNLQQLILPDQTLHDLVIIEFDITVYADQLSFNYVFASEEYPEFLDFNDVFGFYISGPGINGTQNLALIPGTNTPVSVSNINQVINSQYFRSNGTGATPFDNSEIQYDGFTTVLRAQREVAPCETYHIKLAIADVNDGNLDSGVFLEEGSFSSEKTPFFDVTYEHDRFDYLIEGCNNAVVTIIRNEQDLGKEVNLEVVASGTALQGTHYDSIPLTFSFGANELFKYIEINTILDSIKDSIQTITLTLLSDCSKFEYYDIIELEIKPFFEMELENVKKCGPGIITLNKNAISTDYYLWNSNQNLSCFSCPSPTTDVLQDSNFEFEVYDSISGCLGIGNQFVKYENIIADFEYELDDCNTSLEVQFKNLSEGNTQNLWEFGDGETSSQRSPLHEFKSALNKTEAQEFMVSLTVSNAFSNCNNSIRKNILISEPLYIPNVVSPNNDFINDVFTIKGINGNCWSLEVYNRWGKMVYDETPFNNQFSPIQLADGIYYFRVINLNDNEKSIKGYFNVFK